MEIFEQTRDNYLISTDKSLLNVDFIHQFLAGQSYWATNIPIETVRNSLHLSLCFGVYHAQSQIGFARVISDFATIAYLGDVFIDTEYRGRGLSKWLMQCVVEHPHLQGLRRWILGTMDAHNLYTQFGFTPLSKPERWMERFNPNVYSH
jgi:GNAT superfamily N-acetyltransferase